MVQAILQDFLNDKKPRGKSSFNFGLECKIEKWFLIIFLTSGKLGLKVVTKGNSFFASLARE